MKSVVDKSAHHHVNELLMEENKKLREALSYWMDRARELELPTDVKMWYEHLLLVVEGADQKEKE